MKSNLPESLFLDWHLKFNRSDVAVVAFSGLSLHVALDANELRAARSASPTKRFDICASLKGPHGEREFKFAAYELGSSFALFVAEDQERAAFLEIFTHFVLKPALRDHYVPTGSQKFPGWTWCFFGLAGDIVDVKPNGDLVAADPGGRCARILEVHRQPMEVDLAFRGTFVTSVPAFLDAPRGKMFIGNPKIAGAIFRRAS